MNSTLQINQYYSTQEVENAFQTRFGGGPIQGIIPLKNPSRSIIVRSSLSGPYDDRMHDNSEYLYYIGHGENQDQKYHRGNKALAEANIHHVPIYGFIIDKSKGEKHWLFLGLLQLIDYKYIKSSEGYRQYQYKLQKKYLPNDEQIIEEQQQLQEEAQTEAPSLTADTTSKTTSIQRKTRSSAFSTNVKILYNNQCSVCRRERYTVAHYPEVEAAHIYPKEKNGSDDLRNGLALCKLHHWAFDIGLLYLDDNYVIKTMQHIINNADYKEIFDFAGQKILLPEDKRYYPHPIYIKAHRELHGFDE